MRRKGITLVEMLIAMAITLVMMAAVVTVFANVSSSVQRRRASIELGTQLRHVRNVLQRDLQGATCPALPWQRPESNHGYIEIVEGPYSDSYPSMFTDGVADSDNDGAGDELDPAVSLVPRYGDGYGDIIKELGQSAPGRKIDYNGTLVQRADPSDPTSGVVSTLNGLGDYDDILALTVRNEEEPFVGRVPADVRVDSSNARTYGNWGTMTIESPLAEVVWFAVENPTDSAGGFFGEPGLRTIYRRVLLIAPWAAPYRYTDPQTGATADTYADPADGGSFIRTQPGVVRVLPKSIGRDDIHEALAALIAFQEQYDLSVRLEFNPLLGSEDKEGRRGRYLIVANTLSDLTKRENRFEHHYYWFNSTPQNSQRSFPFALVSLGSGYGGSPSVAFVPDVSLQPGGPATNATAVANTTSIGVLNDFVMSYRVVDTGGSYLSRPFAFVAERSTLPSTVRAMLNDEGEVIHLVHGPAPLWGNRRGQDVMLTDALGFDIRAYDPGAPIFAVPDSATDPSSMTVVEPADAAWLAAYAEDRPDTGDLIGDGSTNAVRFLAQGAYVDLGYSLNLFRGLAAFDPAFHPSIDAIEPWFFRPVWLSDRLDNALAPGYAVYDTWSFHYENNGVNEDNDEVVSGAWQPIPPGGPNGTPTVDEATNGFDDFGVYRDLATGGLVSDIRNGIDDVGERETAPPYERPLRALEIKLRAFERDSQQMREVTVSQAFAPE